MNIFRATCKTVVSCLLLWATLCTAQTITGTVHNETTGKPSAGDDVVLLRLSNGMLDETQTKTDNQGAFSLNVQFADQPHIVRVLHQGVNYDRSVTSNAPLEIKVFDSAAKVEGIGENISITKVESDGTTFNITELHEINNASSPQRTQANPRNLELSLPAKAQVDSVMVEGPGGIRVKTEAKPFAGKAGHYGIGFPLRPGLTHYWVKYHLPYGQRVAFHPVLPYPTVLFSVQYPNSMTFVASENSGYHRIVDQDGMKVEAIGEAKAGPAPAFQLSGVGALPNENQKPTTQARTVPAQPPVASAASKPDHAQTPAKPSGATPAQGPTAKAWAITAVVIGALGMLVFLLWRAQATKQQAAREALKQKLFQLENDRLRGSISAEQYAAAKETLNQTLEQVVGKAKL
jgi:hypothetical protein